MRIKKLELKNFRGFEDLTIDFPEGEGGLAVFVGVNGSGKTSVVEALGFMFQEFVVEFFGVTSNNPISFSNSDININDSEIKISIAGNNLKINDWAPETFNMVFTKDFTREVFSPKNTGKSMLTVLSKNETINVSILTFYRTSRIVEQEEEKIIRLPSAQSEAFHNAFDKRINFSGFINWFIEQTNIENQLKIDKENFEESNPKLDSIRSALSRFLSSFPYAKFSSLRVGTSPRSNRFTSKQVVLIDKNALPLEINQLSEGERMTLMLVADIAYRLSVANPSIDTKDGNGVVLIDEIDLHLHPSWQRAIIPCLRATFPNIQFILTTHSPQVLSNVPRENVFVLEDFKLVKHTPHTFGRDSNSILWELFGVRERPEEAQKDFSKLSRLLNDPEKDSEAKELLAKLSEKYGEDDNDVVRARLHLEFLTES